MFQNIFDKLEQYLENKLSLIKIDIDYQLRQFYKQLLMMLVLVLCVSMAMLFLSVAAAQYINQFLQSMYAGYLILALLYLAIGISFYIYLRFTNKN